MNTFEKLPHLKNQVAVITGGAGQIGFATAHRLAASGARVVLIVRKNLADAETKVKQLPDFATLNHFVLEADITKSDQLEKAAAEVQRMCGLCHILVNAAGMTKSIQPKNLDELTDDVFDDIVKTNLRGVYATIRSFSPMLKESGSGLIINISSTASLRASQSNVAYSSAKAGLNLMTQTLAHALAPEIRVLAVAPGFLVKATSGAIKTENFNEIAANSSPLKRIGYAEDIANAIEACATSIRFATGSIFVIDGGRTL